MGEFLEFRVDFFGVCFPMWGENLRQAYETLARSLAIVEFVD